MNEKTPLKKVLNNMLDTGLLGDLAQFEDPSTWDVLKEKDRELLGLLYIMQAELQLKTLVHSSDFEMVKKSLNRATSVASDSSQVWYRKAQVLSSLDCETDLNEAYSAYAKAVELDPSQYRYLSSWAQLLSKMAHLNYTTSYADAEEKFQQAFYLLEDFSQKTSSLEKGRFYWSWALLWTCIARHSGEASDWQKAIYKFAQAKESQERDKQFNNDYATALFELALLINSEQLVSESIALRQVALALSKTDEHKDSDEVIAIELHLGISYQLLFVRFSVQSAFEHAQHYLKKVCCARPDQMISWLKWGQLLIAAGKVQRNLEHFDTALVKLTVADNCQKDHPEILGKMAEALVYLGTHQENLDLLKQAEEKIQMALRLAPEDSEWWGVYGFCCNELGKYFGEETYFLKAIDKIEHALSLTPKAAAFWHLIGFSFFSLAELKDSLELVQKSIQCFDKAVVLDDCKNANLYNDWGVACMKLAEFLHEKSYVEQAIEKFEIALAIEAHEELFNIPTEWLYNYGCALDFLGDFTEDEVCYAKAIQILSQLLSLDPEHENGRYNLALAYSHLGELTSDLDALRSANQHFQILLTHDPEDEMAWNDWGLSQLHHALLVRDPLHKEFDQLTQEAEHHFLQSLQLGNLQVFYNLACLYSLQGNYQDCLHFLEKALTTGTLPSIEDIMHDEWLEGIRHTVSFKTFLNQLPHNPD